MHFESFETGHFSADIIGIVVDEVSAAGDSSAVLFVLFWVYSADNSGIGDSLTGWHH